MPSPGGVGGAKVGGAKVGGARRVPWLPLSACGHVPGLGIFRGLSTNISGDRPQIAGVGGGLGGRWRRVPLGWVVVGAGLGQGGLQLGRGDNGQKTGAGAAGVSLA